MVAWLTTALFGLGATSSLSSSKREEELHRYNAAIQRQNAKTFIQQSKVEQNDAAYRAKVLLGSNITQTAGSGLQNTGSLRESIYANHLKALFDIEKIKYRGQIRAHQARQHARYNTLKAESVKKGSAFKALGAGVASAGGLDRTLKGFGFHFDDETLGVDKQSIDARVGSKASYSGSAYDTLYQDKINIAHNHSSEQRQLWRDTISSVTPSDSEFTVDENVLPVATQRRSY